LSFLSLAGTPLDGDAVEISYEADGPIALGDFAASLAGLDAIFAKVATSEGRLSVSQMRAGSIIATLQPFLPVLGQAVATMDAALTVSDFARRLRSSIDAFSGKETVSSADAGAVAKELQEVLRPLTGRVGAQLGVAHVKYRHRNNGKTVEFEATYGAAEIDRAAINAEKFVASPLLEQPQPEPGEARPSLLRKVRLTLHQANSGPAKVKGQTGDRGIIQSETTKPLPVYFAQGIDRLKEKMVGGAKNPLTSSYTVDVIVTREGDEARCYTVIEVYGPARAPRVKPLPLLKAVGEGKRSRKRK